MPQALESAVPSRPEIGKITTSVPMKSLNEKKKKQLPFVVSKKEGLKAKNYQ